MARTPILTALKLSILPVAVITALALGSFAPRDGRQATPAQATPENLVALNEGLCISLGVAFAGLPAATAALNCQSIYQQTSMQTLSKCLEWGCGLGPVGIYRPRQDLFDGLDLDANQIHDTQFYSIMVWVDDDFPVRFTSDRGNFISSSDGVSLIGQELECGPGSANWVPPDPDCDGDATTAGDGMVAARFAMTAADGDDGVVNINAIQDSISFPVQLTVTGTPEKIVMQHLFGKDTIQTGATDPTPTGEFPDKTDCNFSASTDGVLGAVNAAEKTIVVVKALDDQDREVSGALVNWNINRDENVKDSKTPPDGTFVLNRVDSGGVALPQTPTVDTGALGIGFPQFVCGGRNPGVIDLDVSFATTLSPYSDPDEHEEIQVNVIGPATSMALTAEPAMIDCDGTTTSKVTATLTNAEGDPVANGLDVNFSVVALGIADPLKVDSAAGVASTVVTPLSGAANVTADGQPRGVTVNVSANGELNRDGTHDIVAASILVQCSGGPPPPGGGGAGGGTTPPPTGTIRPPDTGSGTPAGLGWLGIALVGAAAATLAGARALAARRA